MSLRITYDYQVFSWQKYGGISRYYFEIANRIAMEGNEVGIFAPIFVNEYFHNKCNVHPKGIRIPRLPRGTRSIVKAVNLSLSCLLIKPRRNVDIFHETYYSSIDCCPHSAKRVITIHDMIHEKFPEMFFKRDKTRQQKAHAVQRADHVICVSENTRKDLIEILSVPEEKTSVIYHGYSLATNHNTAEPMKVDKPYILYVGAREGYKNFAGLLKAYARSQLLRKEFSLVCFGGGDFGASEMVMMRSLGIDKRSIIHLSGNDNRLSGLYAAATVFVFPSLYEGFGIPPLEAMSFGCPVVCSRTSSLPEVVGDAAELFDPEDDEEMCTAIEKIVSSTEKAKILTECGHKRIAQFSWDKCAKDTLNVYRKILHDSETREPAD